MEYSSGASYGYDEINFYPENLNDFLITTDANRLHKIDKIKEEENKELNIFNWNTNAISPGTEFMDKLSYKIKSEMKTNSLYSSIKIYFSDSYTPGEGEHKILDYIKKNDLDGNIIIYGLDADLIILSFVAHKHNIYLLRESMQFGKPVMNSFLYLDIDELKIGRAHV